MVRGEEGTRVARRQAARSEWTGAQLTSKAHLLNEPWKCYRARWMREKGARMSTQNDGEMLVQCEWLDEQVVSERTGFDLGHMTFTVLPYV